MGSHVPVSMSFRRGLAAALAVTFLAVFPLAAQPASDADAKLRELQSRLDLLMQQAADIQKEIDALKGSGADETIPPVDDLAAIEPLDPAAPAPPLDAPLQSTATPAATKALNPDISVIGNFVGHAGDESPVEERPSLSLDETEIAFEAFVDPYAKAKFFLSVSEEGAEIEEGYINFINLPADLTAKAGRLRANFGKVNTLHTHARAWVDQPLVLTRFFGDEGLGDSGISLSKLLPNRLGLFLEGTAEVFDGNVEDVFGRTNANDLLYVGHLKLYRDLTENSNLELGTSFARGSLPDDGASNQFGGVDLTLRWKPLQRAIYNSFIGRAEVMVNDRDDQPNRALGFYTSADYQLARRWFAGVRFDQSDRPDDPSLTDRGASATVTFWPSEFTQVRGQYRRMFMDGEPDTNELLLQINFSIGAHGAHTF